MNLTIHYLEQILDLAKGHNLVFKIPYKVMRILRDIY
jgi:hypothetical protein